MSDLSVPKLERIARDIEETLQSVRVANGYFNDLIVERRRGLGNTMRDRFAVLFQGDAEAEDGPTQFHNWLQNFMVLVYISHSNTATSPTDEVINTIRADIERVLMVDPRRGGLAHDTIIRSVVLIPYEDASAEGVIVSFDVRYRTALADPFN